MKYEKYYHHFIENNQYPRQLTDVEVISGASSLHLSYQGKKVINFSSSDYLGLSHHPYLIEQAQYYAEHYGVGSSASRLVTGNFAFYTELEKKLAKALGKPAALIMGSGYQTNVSVLEAILDSKVLGHMPLIFCDKFCHASIFAATRHFKTMQRFRHNDLNHLRLLLEKHKHTDQQKFIVAESIYSMEGDAVDLAELIHIAKEHQAFLYIDDAHAVGIYGKQGFGKTAEYADDIPIVMGTFSKALGSFGSYIGCSELMKKYLINKCRGLIYSTGLSPAVIGAISAAIELLPTLHAERQQVLRKAEYVKNFFLTENLYTSQMTTHIVPWIIGNAEKTRYASELLQQQGILGTAIQPPSVPVGRSRIRFCLSAAHTDADIEHLIRAIRVVKKNPLK